MKKILFAICLAVAVSCVGKIDLPDHKYPPHLQGTEQEDDKDEGNKDENQTDDTLNEVVVNGFVDVQESVYYNLVFQGC